MYGPTGSGKTELCRVISMILPVPVEVIDASSITTQGFRGADKEDILFALAANHPDLEYGIIIMDEFDKLCAPVYDSSRRNVHKQIQGELLKMIEGTKLFDTNKKSNKKVLNTEQITFICAGAFEGAFDTNIHKAFGFGSKDEDLNAGKNIVRCLEDYGMIPELAGRIYSVIALLPLGEDNLYEILVGKKDSCIENISKLYKVAYDSELEFSDEALHEICRIAVSNGLGARGLNGLVGRACHAGYDAIEEDSKRTIKVTAEMVDEALESL